MINEVQQDAEIRMGKTIDSFRIDLTKIRTGRAHPSLLDHIKVSFYGVDTPLNQAANITIQDARTLQITPFDKSLVEAIEKAIMNSDLGLNPMSAGTVIRVPLPALTEERRKDLIKVVRGEAESARVAIRNIRRDANSTFKELVKEKEISEDEERKAQEMIQKLTNDKVAVVDKMLTEKEAELMEI
jgi:ribosome recycling factor